jgi:hypothetical protein
MMTQIINLGKPGKCKRLYDKIPYNCELKENPTEFHFWKDENDKIVMT